MKKNNKLTINNNLTADVVIDGRQAKITQIKTDKKGNISAFLVPDTTEIEQVEDDGKGGFRFVSTGTFMMRMICTWDVDFELCYEAAKKAGMIKIG